MSQSFDAVRCDSYDSAEAAGPGGFLWDDGPDGRRFFVFKLPGEEGLRVIEIRTPFAPSGAVVWDWNGDKDKPTLTPSINALTVDPAGKSSSLWHGWLRAGRFQPC